MTSRQNGMDWTDQAVSTLRSLWDAGHSTAEIGLRMQVSKNAIVGKAHRLKLPPRPSPIRSPAEGHPKPSTATPSPRPPVTIPVAPDPIDVLSVSIVPIVPAPAKAPEPPPACAVPHRSPTPKFVCQWPIGTPGTSAFRFCGDEPAPGKPYCDCHCDRAYVRQRDAISAAATT